ncbi:MAG: GNAT family N-acetyltransferase [Chloroflexi bacterium]|nr:GNAT family N-acetyltransferase [Chloroflexota bacterium]
MRCHYDDQIAVYRCARTGEYVCLDHARLDVVSVSTRVRLPPLPVRAAQPEDYDAIKEMALMYWGETEVVCFDQTYDILKLPALLAFSDDKLAGMLSYAIEGDRMTIVMLNVHPEFQGRRTARSLLAIAEREARNRGLSRLVVATSNDDLPALYLYQRWGFVISEIKPGAILAHHGREEPGFASIPVRDEIRLERKLG